MENLSNKKFDPNQILNDQQTQNLFGGLRYGTVVTGGRYKGHGDSWYDNNGNGWPDRGDVLVVYLKASAPDPGPDPVTFDDMDKLSDAGVDVQYQ